MGGVSGLVVERDCCMARMVPGDVELVSAGGGAKCVKRFERSNGLDTALYKWLECFPKMSNWCRPGGGTKGVKRFERSNGLDTTLYKWLECFPEAKIIFVKGSHRPRPLTILRMQN